MDDYLKSLNDILTELFITYKDKISNPGVLLSGGIDSSIITFFVFQYFPQFKIFSMGSSQTKDRVFVELLTKKFKLTLPGTTKKRPGRNDPCWCGARDSKTGKVIKYKRCHYPN